MHKWKRIAILLLPLLPLLILLLHLFLQLCTYIHSYIYIYIYLWALPCNVKCKMADLTFHNAQMLNAWDAAMTASGSVLWVRKKALRVNLTLKRFSVYCLLSKIMAFENLLKCFFFCIFFFFFPFSLNSTIHLFNIKA